MELLVSFAASAVVVIEVAELLWSWTFLVGVVRTVSMPSDAVFEFVDAFPAGVDVPMQSLDLMSKQVMVFVVPVAIPGDAGHAVVVHDVFDEFLYSLSAGDLRF